MKKNSVMCQTMKLLNFRRRKRQLQLENYEGSDFFLDSMMYKSIEQAT